MLEMLKFDEKTGSYMQVKKAVQSKNGSVFNFIIHLSNNKLEIIDSPFLAIPEAEMKRYSSINKVITDAEFKLVEILL